MICRIGPSETGHQTDDVFKWMKIKLYMKKSDKTPHRHIFLYLMVMTNVTLSQNIAMHLSFPAGGRFLSSRK
jgi:hypothetical protein